MPIQAIETVFAGFKFRSRLEARWAVFMHTLGIDFDYEPEGFDLGGAGYYLPDFYLEGLKLWLEIKPLEPTPDEKWKAKTFAEMSGQNIAILQGKIAAPEIEYCEGWELAVRSCSYSATVYCGNMIDFAYPYDLWMMDTLPEWLREQGVDAPDYDGTIERARLLKRLDYEFNASDPERAKYAYRHLYGLTVEKNYWHMDRKGNYHLHWNHIGDPGWLFGDLPYAYQRAQQARFEHGATP